MKFFCNSNDLSEALSVVSKALSLKTSIPILEGIKIKAENSTVTLLATDLEIFIEKKIKAVVKLEGEAVVMGRFFADFARKLPDVQETEIEKIDEKLYIKYNENQFEIQCINDDAYPVLSEEIDVEKSFSIKEGDLKDILDKTLFCAAADDSRPILKGCLLEIKDNILTAAALDGYRLAICNANVTADTGDLKIIVASKLLNEICKILGDGENEIKVFIRSGNVYFDLEHTKITVRLMEGQFIDYEGIIPKSCSTLVKINKNELEYGLDRASLVVKNKKNHLKLSIKENFIMLKTNSEISSITENIKCILDGKDLEIAFNVKYIYDVLNKIKEDFIRMEFTNSNYPAVIKPIEGDKFKYIVLPVRLLG